MNTIYVSISEVLGSRFDPYYYKEQISSNVSSHIKVVKLGEIINSIVNGYDFREYSDIGKILYIKVANVKKGEFDFSKIQYVDFDTSTISKNIKLKSGNLLLTRKGTFGNALSLKSDNDYLISSEVFYLDIKKELVSSDYLEIVLNSRYGQLQFDKNKIGAIMGSLSQEAVKQTLIPLLSHDEQTHVVNLYNAAYSTKRKKEAQAKNIIASIDCYMLNMLGINLPTKKTDNFSNVISINNLVNQRIDPYYHQEYFELAFESLFQTKYELVSLKDISQKITSGITPLSGGDSYTDCENGVPFVRSGNINVDGDIDFDNLLYLKLHIHNTKMKSSQLIKGDIMIAIVGATIGQVGIYIYDREANINQAIALVRLNKGIDKQYIKELIKSSIGQLNLDRLKRPVARANINLEEISTMKLILPPFEIQYEISSRIASLREQAKKLQLEGHEILENAKKEIERIILNGK